MRRALSSMLLALLMLRSTQAQPGVPQAVQPQPPAFAAQAR
jgi:hypothetical protein